MGRPASNHSVTGFFARMVKSVLEHQAFQLFNQAILSLYLPRLTGTQCNAVHPAQTVL